MTQPDSKFVVSTRPINRRTAVKLALQSLPINPLVQVRLDAIKARNRLGAPLTEQLRISAFTAKRVPLSPVTVVGGILSTMSTVSLLLAWIQTSASFAALGVLGLTIGLALIFLGRRKSGDSSLKPTPTTALFDDSYLLALDRILDQIAPELPDEIAIQLTEFKQQIIRIARLAAISLPDENFTMEDRMYLTECVRRYLPDTLQSYLMVPQNQRSTQILEQGQTAVSLLLSQLKILRTELDKQELKLSRSTAEDLLKQQRFLESKAKR